VRIKVFYHDKCFDGACSAALFTRFYRERIREHAEFEYQGLVHRAGALFDEADFTGDENAIVDFKYSSSPRVTWWFDHHQSAFLTPEDASHFEHEQSTTKFYDPELPLLHQIHCRGDGAALRLQSRAGRGDDRVGRHHRRSAVRQSAGGGGDENAGHQADHADRVQPGPAIHSQPDPQLAYKPLAEIVAEPAIADGFRN
jgi:hypothetical protein